MSDHDNDSADGRFAPCVSRAVGVTESKQETKKWFIAIVPNNTEKVSSERLERLGYEVFVPTQQRVSIWKDGRRKTRDTILIPGKVLVHCTERQRLDMVSLPFVKKFMVNLAGDKDAYGKRPIAVVPDWQIEKCKFMLGQSQIPVTFTPLAYSPGMDVKIIRGALAGLEGVVTDHNSQQTVVHISIDFLGDATVTIDAIDIEKL